jgi:hypothetical protein
VGHPSGCLHLVTGLAAGAIGDGATEAATDGFSDQWENAAHYRRNDHVRGDATSERDRV